MDVRLDCTPAIVNRTAVFHLVLDVCRALSAKHDCAFQFFTDVVPARDLPRPGNEALSSRMTSLRDGFLSYVLAPATARPSPARALPAPGHEDVTLLFDPLLALCHPVDDRVLVVVHDLTPLTVPRWHDPRVSAAYAEAYAVLQRSQCRFACDSESTAQDLRAALGIRSSRIDVVPLYLRSLGQGDQIGRDTTAEARVRASRQHGRYFLFVGSLEERKNVARLIVAFRRSALAERGYSLVIPGRDANGSAQVRMEADRTPGVVLPGFVTDQHLADLYAGCDGFAYPSLWEGFGLPLLEAMARGVPCLSTNTGASPEIGGDAVLYVDPCDVDSIADGLTRLAALDEDERRERGRQAKERSALFSFDRYLACLESSLERTAASATRPKGSRWRGRGSSSFTRARLRRQLSVADAVLGEHPRRFEVRYRELPDSHSAEYLFLVQQRLRSAMVDSLFDKRWRRVSAWPGLIWTYLWQRHRLKTHNALADGLIREAQWLERVGAGQPASAPAPSREARGDRA